MEEMLRAQMPIWPVGCSALYNILEALFFLELYSLYAWWFTALYVVLPSYMIRYVKIVKTFLVSCYNTFYT